MDDDFKICQTLTSKLRLIAKILPHQKMDTNSMALYNNNAFTNFWRQMYTIAGHKGYSRHDLYNLIDNITDDAYRMLKKYKHNTNTANIHICTNLEEDIMKAKRNILSGIKETYITDQLFVARLEQLSSTIELKISSLHNDNNDESMLNSSYDPSYNSQTDISNNIGIPNKHNNRYSEDSENPIISPNSLDNPPTPIANYDLGNTPIDHTNDETYSTNSL